MLKRVTTLTVATVMGLVGGLPAAAMDDASYGNADQIRPGTWEIVSIASDDAPGDADSGTACAWLDGASMSDDGRYIAFSSEATLDPRDTNGSSQSDAYVRDRKKGTTQLVSLPSNGALPDPGDVVELQPCTSLNRGAHSPEISANGRFVVFSDGRNLTGEVEHLPNADMNVFVRDLRKGETSLVSVDSDNRYVHGSHGFNAVSISGNGRFVAFSSSSYSLDEGHAPDGVLGPAEGSAPCLSASAPEQALSCPMQIFVRDREEGTTQMVSVSSDGAPADRDAPYASDLQISDDGRYVAFVSAASNLVPGSSVDDLCPLEGLPQGGQCPNVFVHDMKTGKTELVSVDSQGQPRSGASRFPQTSASVITPGGRFVVFDSSAPLVPSTGSRGVYVRDRKTGRTEQVSVTSVGELSDGSAASISDDGRYVLFSGDFPAGSVGCPEAEAAETEDQSANCRGQHRYDRMTGQSDWIWKGRSSVFGSAIGSDGRHFLRWVDDDAGVVKGDSNGSFDIFLRDVGVARLGLGGVLPAASGNRIGIEDGRRFRRRGLLNLRDDRGDVPFGALPADIIGVRIAHRPDLDDIYVRIDVDRLGSPESVGLPLRLEEPEALGLVFVVRLRVGQVDLEIRIAGDPAPRFGLFRCASSSVCTQAGSLRGGFGTAGESVVTAVPLKSLGLETGGTISELEVVSGYGTYEGGPLRRLDVAHP